MGTLYITFNTSVEADYIVGISTGRTICVGGSSSIGSASSAVEDQSGAGYASLSGRGVEDLICIVTDTGVDREDVGEVTGSAVGCEVIAG